MDLRYLHVLLIASAPFTELRGAIPYGLFLNLPVEKVVIVAILGNLIPVFPLLLFLDFLKKLALRFRYTAGITFKVLERIERKKKIVEEYGYLGLVIFVAIPLPVTGAYTGSILASIMGLDRIKSFTSISAGVLISGGIVTLLSTGALRFMGL